jgi:hypothetical protein
MLAIVINFLAKIIDFAKNTGELVGDIHTVIPLSLKKFSMVSPLTPFLKTHYWGFFKINFYSLNILS